MEVVAIPGQEELGTADSLRRVGDRLAGSEVLVVAGDLLLEPGLLRGLTDTHRSPRQGRGGAGQGLKLCGVWRIAPLKEHCLNSTKKNLKCKIFLKSTNI